MGLPGQLSCTSFFSCSINNGVLKRSRLDYRVFQMIQVLDETRESCSVNGPSASQTGKIM